MHSIAIILILISITYAGTIAPLPHYVESRKVQGSSKEQSLNGADNLAFAENYPPPSSHIYPTYPEYLNNGEIISVRAEYGKKHAIMPSTVAVQNISFFSYENIISTLIPFVTSLTLYAARAGTLLLGLLIIVYMGIGSISLICTHTSICNKSFLDKIEAS